MHLGQGWAHSGFHFLQVGSGSWHSVSQQPLNSGFVQLLPLDPAPLPVQVHPLLKVGLIQAGCAAGWLGWGRRQEQDRWGQGDPGILGVVTVQGQGRATICPHTPATRFHGQGCVESNLWLYPSPGLVLSLPQDPSHGPRAAPHLVVCLACAAPSWFQWRLQECGAMTAQGWTGSW